MQELEQTRDLAFWVSHVEAYEKKSKPWEKRGQKIVDKYTDSSDSRKDTAFNILWSNVQTLHPALYSGLPIPNVDRRFEDDEEVNTTVAQVVERALDYFVKRNDFDDCMNQAVLDRLLPGRGTAWVRYVPNFKDVQIVGNEEIKGDGVQLTDDREIGDEAMPDQELYSEDAVLDYVHWTDFGHSVARTWQEVRAVWRKVYLDRKELKDRFGDAAVDAPLDASGIGEEKSAEDACDKTTVYELWDRVGKKAYWFNKDMADFLDSQDDPLRLQGFFPCPKPIYATIANNGLIPTPDYVLYQDQANELDVISQRIAKLTEALRVVGVYDASAEGVQKLLSGNSDNKLIPVDQWAVFADKGGLKGVVDFLPIEMVVNVLTRLYEVREKTKQDIYEITGISDIVRGSTVASETATAQRIKGQFATLRLDNMQKEIERFARDCVKLMSEIISEHFSIETLKDISGIRLMTEAEKQQVAMQQQQHSIMAQQAQQMGQKVPPAPELPESIQKMMEKPTWEQIESVLRSEGARCFRVDVQTDSTIKADQEADKQARIEFLTAAGGFIQQAAQIPVPELQPLLMEMLRFGVGGFKAGREIETEFNLAQETLLKKSKEPATPPVDPLAMEKEKLAVDEAIKMQGVVQDFEIAKIKANNDFEIGRQKIAQDAQLDRERMILESTGQQNNGVQIEAVY